MISIGAVGVAMYVWRQEHGKKPLVNYLQEAFSTVEPKSEVVKGTGIRINVL